MTIVGGMTLVEFLQARIAEDEAEAKPMAGLDDDDRGGWAIVYAERVLAECAAKRAIIAEWEPPESFRDYDLEGALYNGGIEEALSHLATVYKDHPDYQQEWA